MAIIRQQDNLLLAVTATRHIESPWLAETGQECAVYPPLLTVEQACLVSERQDVGLCESPRLVKSLSRRISYLLHCIVQFVLGKWQGFAYASGIMHAYRHSDC
jgi:hypothetical protein